jgi:arylsulfatase A-like enzyme
VIRRVDKWLDRVGCPFFLFVLTIDPHWPYQPPDGFDRYGPAYTGKIDRHPLAITKPGLSESDRERARNLYFGEVAFADDAFGRVTDRLAAEGRLDETIVVFTSDHGEEFWEHDSIGHGSTLFEESVHVPLILRYPRAISVARIASPASLVDVAPTLLALAGIPAPYPLDGTSLLEREAPERAIYGTLDLDGHRVQAINRSPWKLVFDRSKRTHSLFNLNTDDGEQFDVARRHPERVEALASELVAASRARAARRDELLEGASAREVPENELPIEARKALEALGYLEPGSVDSGRSAPR